MYHGRQGAVAVGVSAARRWNVRRIVTASAMPWTAWSSEFKRSPKLLHIILKLFKSVKTAYRHSVLSKVVDADWQH